MFSGRVRARERRYGRPTRFHVTILQTIVQEDKRGRVMSLYATAIAGMAPFGSLFSGILAAHIGPPVPLTISGIACALGAVFFRLYFRMPGAAQAEGKAPA